MAAKSLRRYLADAKKDDRYWIEHTKLDFAVALERRRRLSGLSYAAMAKTIGTSAAYITKIFRGDANLTIESMVKLARAAGGQVNIRIINERPAIDTWLGAALRLEAGQQAPGPTSGTVVHINNYRGSAKGPVAA